MPDYETIDFQPLDDGDVRYPNAQDAHMRLTRTIIRFNDEPVFINEIVPDMRGMCWAPLSNNYYRIHANDKRLDISSAPLGFSDIKDQTYYIMRSTVNSQKQGVNPAGLYVKYCGSGDIIRGLSPDRHVIKSLAKTIVNNYPTLEEILSGKLSGAFSRHFAIGRTQDKKVSIVYRKFQPIGYFMHSDKCFLLTKDGFRSRDRLFNVLSKQTTGGQYDVQELPS